ncbi:uncharacterized protein [Lolium perenne]|uniref:uncharacterized protein n=1 Tax=Lolium perenne TaxID=4522 RepID=UPI0021F646AB|nr:uncharacterized protein LOC127310783 [Lolium perenne]
MLRLRSSILTQALYSSSATLPKNSSLHYRHLFATVAAPLNSPSPSIGVVDYKYLVDTCGLTSRSASWASTKLYHLKSTSNPDAVRAFLADLGLPGAHVATLIAKDPEFLCAKVDKTLSPKVAEIAALGLSRPDIARLLVLVPRQFRSKTIVSKLQHYLPLFGSYENLLWALRTNAYILSPDLDKAVKPNTEFLRECGLRDAEIGKLCVRVQWMLTSNPERVRTMVAIAEGTLGVPRGSGMFAQALQAIGFRTKGNLTAKVDYLKNTFRWSDAEVAIAICRDSMLLSMPKDLLQRRANFLISEVGVEPAYIASDFNFMLYCAEAQVRARHYVVKFLKENGLLDPEWSHNTIVTMFEKVFVEEFICPHKEAAPHLAEDYAAARSGKVPDRFKNFP